MDQIEKFILNLSSILVFMTAIEIIAPENSMKKYIKFVLGLILIAFMINPIVYFASNGQNIVTKKISEFQNDIDKESVKTSIKGNTSTENKVLVDSFKKKFEDNLCDLLKDKFNNNTFDCTLTGNVDIDNNKFKVDKINIFVTKKADGNKKDNSNNINNNEIESVKKIEKIDVGDSSNNSLSTVTDDTDKFLTEIQDYVKENVQIDKDKIVVKYK